MFDHSTQTKSDFSRARFKAALQQTLAGFRNRPNELISFDAVKRSLKIFGQNYLGVRSVPLASIVGSATLRYHDFDRAFLPTQDFTESRWRRVDEAYYEAKNLPPVQLYKIGETYFVRDGHHRISVAREKNQEFIDAEVIEVKTRVPLTPDLTVSDLEIVGEYDKFIEQTHIDKLRPDHSIRFSEPDGYSRLLEHIAVHRYFLGAEQGHRILWDEAVTSWYDNFYMPTVHIIREHDLLKDFPSRTEADLYLWIMDHYHYLNQGEENVALKDAALDFAQHYSERLDKKILRGVRNAVAEILGGEYLPPLVGTMTDEPATNPHDDENGQ
jgi:hypothetical protein